jgi:probable rRNA maturation factor
VSAGAAREIVLQNPDRYPEAAARQLRPWLERLVAALAPPGARALGVRFAGDREVRRANRAFRGQDEPTDVLSFPGGSSGEEGAQAGERYLGDILISVPAARRQAAAAGRDPERELRVLLLHGVLHCLGHDHEADGGEMERLERRLRRRWIGPGGGSQDGRLAPWRDRHHPEAGAGCDRPHPAGGPRRASPRPAGRAGRGGRRAG